MRIAVIGAAGQLGSDLVPRLGDRAWGLTHADLELTDPDSIASAFAANPPTHIVNCAAYNLVDRAEDEPEQAFRINALGARNLARWCATHEATLCHLSTDYVFGREVSQRPWTESDPTGPVSAYGVSKLAGEDFVRSLCPRHLVVRTCGLYGHRAARGKGNFVETMLRLGRERPELKVVHDQRCTPTATADLADALVGLLDAGATGLFHATNAGDCSWYEFACEIFRQAGISVTVTPIPAAAYGARARRPDYSVLAGERLAATLGRPLPDWRDALSRYLATRQ